MKKLLEFLIPAILLATMFAGIAYAQVFTPSYWVKIGNNLYPINVASTTIGTSTANGAFNNITISGTCTGCGTGGASTSSANTWSQPQSFNGVNNTGNATSTSFSSNSTSSSNLFNINSTFYVPSNFATAGCAGSSTATTLQGCVQVITNYASGIASGTTIWITNNVPAANWTGSINLNTNGFPVQINCIGGTVLQYGGVQGAATSGAVTFNFGNPGGHDQLNEFAGCNLWGHTTKIIAAQVNTATTTGVYFGGNQGAVNINFQGNVNGFGRNIEYGANDYMNQFTGTSSGGNCGFTGMTGCLVQYDTAANSGEHMTLTGNYVDPGNSTTTNAIYIQHNALADLFCTNLSLDDVAVFQDYGNNVQCNTVHIENSAYGTYGQYIPWYATSSQASFLSLTQVDIANDSNTTTTGFQTIVKHGVNFYAAGIKIDNYGGSSINQFSDHSLNNGSESEQICQIQTSNGSGLTNIVSNQAYSQAVGAGCVEDQANSYPYVTYIDSANTGHIRDGNQDVATFNSLGAWTIGSAANASLVTIQKALAAATSISAGGTAYATSSLQTLGSFGAADTVGSAGFTLGAMSPMVTVFTGGSAATDTLPLISASQGDMTVFKNRGSAALVILASSSDLLYLNATATSYSLAAGSSTAFQNDGTYWDQLWK